MSLLHSQVPKSPKHDGMLPSTGVIGPIPSALSCAIALKAWDQCLISDVILQIHTALWQDIKNTPINSLKAVTRGWTGTFLLVCCHSNTFLTSVYLQRNFSKNSIFVFERCVKINACHAQTSIAKPRRWLKLSDSNSAQFHFTMCNAVRFVKNNLPLAISSLTFKRQWWYDNHNNADFCIYFAYINIWQYSLNAMLIVWWGENTKIYSSNYSVCGKESRIWFSKWDLPWPF